MNDTTSSHSVDQTPHGAVRKLTPRVSPPCSKRLRSDLLTKLGIVDERSPLRAPLNASDSQKSQKTVLGTIKVIKAPLKRDEGPDPMTEASPSNLLGTIGAIFRYGSPTSVSTASSTLCSDDASSTSSSSERRRSLTFDEEVSVVHIPHRHQYSDRIRCHLWHSPESLQASVMRNTIEYAADGWSWQGVREEDQHIRCQESGELIHPVHQEIARLIRQEQGLPDDTPVWTPFLKQAPIGACNPTTTEG